MPAWNATPSLQWLTQAASTATKTASVAVFAFFRIAGRVCSIFINGGAIVRPHGTYLIHLQNMATIADFISAGSLPVTEELAALIGVTARTAGRYLRTMREFGAPLEYDRNARGYRFSSPWQFETGLVEWLQRNPLPRTRQTK